MKTSAAKAAGALAGAALLLSGCATASDQPGGDAAGELRTVQFVLGWTPTVNESGIYVADELGYFAEEGIKVEVVASPSTANTTLVGTGKAEFALTTQETVTQLRDQDVPIVSIAAVIAHNTSGFASLPAAGISEPGDFQGKTYGGWGSPIEDAIIRTLIENDGGAPDDFTNVTLGATSVFQNLQSGTSDFGWIYWATDAIPAEREGIEFDYIDLAKEGLDWYTPVIATNETLIDDDPELVQGFIRAAAKGWEYAIAHPDKTADIVLQHVPDLDPVDTRASLDWLAGQWQADAKTWGYQEPKTWDGFTAWLQQAGIVSDGFDPKDAFTNRFIESR